MCRPCTSIGHRTQARQRALWLVLLCIVCGAAMAAPRQAAVVGEIRLLSLDGVINPLTARYLERGLRQAADAGAQLVVVRLDTPGGLESSMRQMTQSLLSSPVPVAVYVAPPGARAASAGMFLTLAAHIAAMAPGTNIGAAHPVGLGGQVDEVMVEKLVQDAAALARSVAAERGRNTGWAERAVRKSVSISAHEALEQGVIDLIAADLSELLRQIDGRRVATGVGEWTLRTAGVPVAERPMTLPERILLVIIDPNIAYILFTLGTIGLIAELYHPGTLFPGITGAISLILAFVAFGNLPVNWAGVLLLILAFALFVAELYAEGIGFLAVGGLIAFVLGSLMLFAPARPTWPGLPALRVSPWLIMSTTTAIGGFFLIVLRAVVRTRHEPVATGIPALIGKAGITLSDLAPFGTVRVDSETWSAVADPGPISSGEPIRVVDVDGVTLRVTPARRR